MDVVDDGVLSLALRFVRYASKVKNLHVPEGRCGSHGEHVELHERLLEHVGKQVPVLFCERTGSETIRDAARDDSRDLSHHDNENEQVASPRSLLVNQDKERSEERQLQVSGDGPAPEEAAVVWRLKVGIDIADHEQMGPPVVFAIGIHQVGSVPDRACTQVGEDSPSTEEDEVVHGGEAEVLACVELQAILNSQMTLSLIELKELVGAKESRDCSESLHHDVAANDDSKDELLEEALDHPRVDRLRAHQELGCDTQLPKEEAKEFYTFNGIELFIIPQLTLCAR